MEMEQVLSVSLFIMMERKDDVVRLDGDNNDSLEILVQDDLSSIVDIQMKASGHYE